MTPQQQIIAKCNEMSAKCMQLYGLDMRGVRVSFDLKGKAAGRAGGTAYRMPASAYWVKFNHDMLHREAFDHLLNSTVPHEFAHVVCYMRPELGSKHNEGWARVCEALGGTGARYHKEEVVFGKGVTYEYTTDRGHKVRVSQAIHKRIQTGTVYSYKHGMGKVNALCAHSIVGVSGRTLAAPVVKQAPNSAPALEAFAKQQAAKQPVPPAANGLSAVARARAIMVAARNTGRSYSEIIAAIVFSASVSNETAEDIYWANHEALGLPAAPELAIDEM